MKKFRSTEANTSLSNKKIKAEICACLCVRACAFYYRNKRIINPFLMRARRESYSLVRCSCNCDTRDFPAAAFNSSSGARAHTKQTHRWKIFSPPRVFKPRAATAAICFEFQIQLIKFTRGFRRFGEPETNKMILNFPFQIFSHFERV